MYSYKFPTSDGFNLTSNTPLSWLKSALTCLPVYLDLIDEKSRSSTVDIVGYLNIRYSMKMLPTITSALSAFGSS